MSIRDLHPTALRVEQYLSKIKVIRRIGAKIIDFLAQLEDFQKKLWLKKKFVVETSWCVRLGCIPEEFYAEIAANDAQCEEWVRLFAIDRITGDLGTPGYGVPLDPEFLRTQPTLVVDTRHFPSGFTARLLETGQPHIKSLSHQYVISEAIVQRRPDTLLPDTDLRWLALQQIERHMANHSHIMRRVASTNPTLVLTKRHVQSPVQLILDSPVRTHRSAK